MFTMEGNTLYISMYANMGCGGASYSYAGLDFICLYHGILYEKALIYAPFSRTMLELLAVKDKDELYKYGDKILPDDVYMKQLSPSLIRKGKQGIEVPIVCYNVLWDRMIPHILAMFKQNPETFAPILGDKTIEKICYLDTCIYFGIGTTKIPKSGDYKELGENRIGELYLKARNILKNSPKKCS